MGLCSSQGAHHITNPKKLHVIIILAQQLTAAMITDAGNYRPEDLKDLLEVFSQPESL